jgi:hypothetical protein
MFTTQDRNRDDQRIARSWTRRHFAFYAVALAALLGFLLSRGPAMQWIADGVTAEYVGIESQSGVEPVALAHATPQQGAKPMLH